MAFLKKHWNWICTYCTRHGYLCCKPTKPYSLIIGYDVLFWCIASQASFCASPNSILKLPKRQIFILWSKMLPPLRPGVFNHGFPLFGGLFPLFYTGISENAGPLFSTRIYRSEKWCGLFDNCSSTPQADGKRDSCILVYGNWNVLRFGRPFSLVPWELWHLFDHLTNIRYHYFWVIKLLSFGERSNLPL